MLASQLNHEAPICCCASSCLLNLSLSPAVLTCPRYLTPFRAEWDPKDLTERLVVVGRYISEDWWVGVMCA
jgi:hypothetical protein